MPLLEGSLNSPPLFRWAVTSAMYMPRCKPDGDVLVVSRQWSRKEMNSSKGTVAGKGVPAWLVCSRRMSITVVVSMNACSVTLMSLPSWFLYRLNYASEPLYLSGAVVQGVPRDWLKCFWLH
jgi:hypothetical protein